MWIKKFGLNCHFTTVNHNPMKSLKDVFSVMLSLLIAITLFILLIYFFSGI